MPRIYTEQELEELKQVCGEQLKRCQEHSDIILKKVKDITGHDKAVDLIKTWEQNRDEFWGLINRRVYGLEYEYLPLSPDDLRQKLKENEDD